MSPERKYKLRKHTDLDKYRIDTWNEVAQTYDEGTTIYDTLIEATTKLMQIRYDYLLHDSSRWRAVPEEDIFGAIQV